MGGALLDGIVYINIMLSVAKQTETVNGVTKYYVVVANSGVEIKKKEMASEAAANTAINSIKTAIPNGFIDFDTILA